MKKYLKLIMILSILFITTGCSNLYSYRDVVRKTNGLIAKDLIIEDPGYFNKNNGLKAYTAYLVRNRDKKITIINGKDTLLPFGQNFLCTDFAEVYLVSEFDYFKRNNRYNFLYDIEADATNSGLHPRCKNLRFTINCNDKEKYLDIIDKYIEYLNKEGIYLNKEGLNRYEIFCQDGQQYYKNRNY